jgi:hypothetical protein
VKVKSLFLSLRRDIDVMLSFLGLSQDDVQRTHIGDNDEEAHDAEDQGWPSAGDSESVDRDEEQRGQPSVSRLRPEKRRFACVGRLLPLARVPLVWVAQRAARLRCVALRGGHDWHEFRADGARVTYYCADCQHEQRHRPKRDRALGWLS